MRYSVRGPLAGSVVSKERIMGEVAWGYTCSLDGFIAGPSFRVVAGTTRPCAGQPSATV